MCAGASCVHAEWSVRVHMCAACVNIECMREQGSVCVCVIKCEYRVHTYIESLLSA